MSPPPPEGMVGTGRGDPSGAPGRGSGSSALGVGEARRGKPVWRRGGRVMEDACLVRARVMEAPQVMSLLYVLLLVALEQLLLVEALE